MLRKATLSLTLVAAATLAFAAAPTGRWSGTIDAGGMPLLSRFTFTVAGETLTGTMELPEHGADFPILEGVAKGDSIRFSVDFAGMATMRARGRVGGDSLYLASDVGAGETCSVFARIP